MTKSNVWATKSLRRFRGIFQIVLAIAVIFISWLFFKTYDNFLAEESCDVESLNVTKSKFANTTIPSLRRSRFQIVWTVAPGTDNWADMCYTPDGLLAVARGDHHSNVVLYDGNGHVVKVSTSSGFSLQKPTGIAYYPPREGAGCDGTWL